MSKTVNKLNLVAMTMTVGLGVTAALLATATVSAADRTETEQVQASINDSLTLDVIQPAAGGPENMEANPGSGDVATGYSDTYASTNSATGATLKISMVSADGANTPKGALWGQTNTAAHIARLTGDGSAIGANEWAYRWFDITSTVETANAGAGYSIDTTDVTADDTAAAGSAGYWNAVPDNGSDMTIWNDTNFSTAGEKWVRNVYGALVNVSLAADDYRNSVVFTLSANPAP